MVCDKERWYVTRRGGAAQTHNGTATLSHITTAMHSLLIHTMNFLEDSTDSGMFAYRMDIPITAINSVKTQIDGTQKDDIQKMVPKLCTP